MLLCFVVMTKPTEFLSVVAVPDIATFTRKANVTHFVPIEKIQEELFQNSMDSHGHENRMPRIRDFSTDKAWFSWRHISVDVAHIALASRVVKNHRRSRAAWGLSQLSVGEFSCRSNAIGA